MKRVDDLGVVDVVQVGRRDAEIGVAELALDDVEQNALRAISMAWAGRS